MSCLFHTRKGSSCITTSLGHMIILLTPTRRGDVMTMETISISSGSRTMYSRAIREELVTTRLRESASTTKGGVSTLGRRHQYLCLSVCYSSFRTSCAHLTSQRLEAEARRLFKLPSHKHIVIIQREPPQATKAIAFNWETSTYVRMQTISVEPVAASSAGAPRPARPTYTGSTYGTTDTSTSGVATFLIWVAAASYIGWVVHRGK